MLPQAKVAVAACVLIAVSIVGCSGGSISDKSITPSNQLVLHDVQPDDGIAPIVEFVKSARNSIDISVYAINPNYSVLVDSLVAAVKNGIPVRVSISRQLEGKENPESGNAVQVMKMLQLQGMGINAQLSRPEFQFGHEKVIILDAGTPQARALIGDWNLEEGYFGPSHFGPVGARGFGVLDTNLDDVAEISAYFNANFPSYQPWPEPTRGSLVWSPDAPKYQPRADSVTAFIQFINNAQRTLDIYVAFISTSQIVLSAIIERAKSGVVVRMIGNGSALKSTVSTAQIKEISDAGIAIVFDPPAPNDSATMFVHAKTIIADAGLPSQRAFVGSQNLFLSESLLSALELGAFITDDDSIAQLSSTFNRDFSVSHQRPLQNSL